MITLLIILLVGMAVMACARMYHNPKAGQLDKTAVAVTYATVGVDEFQTAIAAEGMQLLDVRTLEEFEEGHIAGAVLVDVNESDFVDKAVAVLDKERPVAVYCRSGRRSARAATLLDMQGYVVTNLDGGVIAWQAEGKTLVK